MSASTLLTEPRLLLEPERLEDETKEILHRLSLAEEEARQARSLAESFAASLKLYEERLQSLESFQAVATMMGAWKAATCIYQANGVCTLWRLSREAAEKLGASVVEANGVYRVRVAEAPWFCGLCPLHRRG